MVVELGTEFLQTAKVSTRPVPTLGEGGTEEQESHGVVFYQDLLEESKT